MKQVPFNNQEDALEAAYLANPPFSCKDLNTYTLPDNPQPLCSCCHQAMPYAPEVIPESPLANLPLFLTVKELAHILRCDRRLVQRHIRNGRISAVRYMTFYYIPRASAIYFCRWLCSPNRSGLNLTSGKAPIRTHADPILLNQQIRQWFTDTGKHKTLGEGGRDNLRAYREQWQALRAQQKAESLDPTQALDNNLVVSDTINDDSWYNL